MSNVYPNFFFIYSPTRSVPQSFVPLRLFPRHDEAIIFEAASYHLQRMMTPLLAQAPQPHVSWFACFTCVSQKQKVCIPCRCGYTLSPGLAVTCWGTGAGDCREGHWPGGPTGALARGFGGGYVIPLEDRWAGPPVFGCGHVEWTPPPLVRPNTVLRRMCHVTHARPRLRFDWVRPVVSLRPRNVQKTAGSATGGGGGGRGGGAHP